VAIMSLNPSITITLWFFVLAEKRKFVLDEDAAAGNKPNILPIVLVHVKYNVIQTFKNCFLIGVNTHNFPCISYKSCTTNCLQNIRSIAYHILTDNNNDWFKISPQHRCWCLERLEPNRQ
jgi:hypothetical protein